MGYVKILPSGSRNLSSVLNKAVEASIVEDFLCFIAVLARREF